MPRLEDFGYMPAAAYFITDCNRCGTDARAFRVVVTSAGPWAVSFQNYFLVYGVWCGRLPLELLYFPL
jgi:hypothetical protein